MRLIILFVVLIFIFASCTFQNINSNDRIPPPTYSGKSGVVLNFINDMPPNKVWQSSGMQVGVEVRNLGTSDVNDILFSVVGYDDSLIQGLSSNEGDSIPFMYGMSDAYPEGGYDTKIFKTSSISFPDETEFFNAPIKVIACYPYRTHAAIPVCVDTITADRIQKNKVCTTGERSISSGQGAPVAVTKVKERILDYAANSGLVLMQFEITIRNVGGGRVIEESKYQKPCSKTESLGFDDVELVVPIVSLGQQQLVCKPLDESGTFIRLYKGEALIVCEALAEKSMDAYQTLLNVELFYGYSNSIVRNVEVVKS